MMWELIGWLITIALVLFGATVLSWLLRRSWFTPNFPRHHKTKVPITQRRG